MVRKGQDAARLGQTQYRRRHGLAARRRQGGRSTQPRTPGFPEGPTGRSHQGHRGSQHRVQVQREAAVLLAQRIEVLSTKSLARCPGRRRRAGHGRSGLAGPGPVIAGRPELGQRRCEIPAFAGCFTRPASGSLGRIPERAGAGGEGGRGCGGSAAAGAGMGRRTARRARRARGNAGEAKQTQGRSRSARASHPGSCAMCWPSWSRRLPRATARPAPAPRRRCAMRSRNTPS